MLTWMGLARNSQGALEKTQRFGFFFLPDKNFKKKPHSQAIIQRINPQIQSCSPQWARWTDNTVALMRKNWCGKQFLPPFTENSHHIIIKLMQGLPRAPTRASEKLRHSGGDYGSIRHQIIISGHKRRVLYFLPHCWMVMWWPNQVRFICRSSTLPFPVLLSRRCRLFRGSEQIIKFY